MRSRFLVSLTHCVKKATKVQSGRGPPLSDVESFEAFVSRISKILLPVFFEKILLGVVTEKINL